MLHNYVFHFPVVVITDNVQIVVLFKNVVLLWFTRRLFTTGLTGDLLRAVLRGCSVLLTAHLHPQQLAQLLVRRLLHLGGTVCAAGGAQCAAVTFAAQALGGSNTGLSTGSFRSVVLVGN